MYGAAVKFYEDFDESKLPHTEKEQLELIMSPQLDAAPNTVPSPSITTGAYNEPPTRRAKYGPKSVHHNKCICLVSRGPFFNTFKTFLHYLYRISISGPHPVPIERSVLGTYLVILCTFLLKILFKFLAKSLLLGTYASL